MLGQVSRRAHSTRPPSLPPSQPGQALYLQKKREVRYERGGRGPRYQWEQPHLLSEDGRL